MKKKHRRAVCKSLIWLTKAKWIFFPIVLVAVAISIVWLDSETWDDKLKRKFKVYDTNPD